AMGNAIDHTAGASATATITSFSDRVIIEVSDNGPGFDPKALKESDELSERGRGIRLMNLTADSVSISSKPSGKGTLVRIVKLAQATTSRLRQKQ
ncbi:MAG: ATP-binding protein, partial [Coriobacteriaceae bacterium]|nr:ATP-binding protein [Coriobacteriaceae bacterium]